MCSKGIHVQRYSWREERKEREFKAWAVLFTIPLHLLFPPETSVPGASHRVSHYVDCGSRFKEMHFEFNMVPHSNQLLQLMIILRVRDIEELGKHWLMKLTETCPPPIWYDAKAFQG